MLKFLNKISRKYDLSGDLDYNVNLFRLLKFDIEKIRFQ